MNVGTKIALAENTTQLYIGAFQGQTRLLRVKINESMEYIDIGAFAGCSSLNYIDVSPNNAFYSTQNGVLYDKNGDTMIYKPLGIA